MNESCERKATIVAVICILPIIGMFFVGRRTMANDLLGKVEKMAAEVSTREAKIENLSKELAYMKERWENDRTFFKTWEGVASFYGKESGIITSTGEPFDGTDFTAAHRTLPPGTIIIVESLETGLATICRINDFGPSKKYPERIVDVSHASAGILGMKNHGLIRVRIHQVRLPK